MGDNTTEFEDALSGLIQKYRLAGLTIEQIVSCLELSMATLEEEEE